MILKELILITRRILYNRSIAIIKITGLTIGIICSIIAFLFVQHELKYDKHFSNTKFVYRLTINNDRARTFHVGQPVIFFDEILSNIPGIESGCRLLFQTVIIKADQTIFSENNFLYVDSNFFEFYGWPIVKGNLRDVLTKPYTVAISEKKAKELFKNLNPVGKIITINNSENYTITGIFKDIPEKSHFRSDFLVSFSTVKAHNPEGYNSWGWHGTALYFAVNPKNDLQEVNKKIAALWNKKSQDLSCLGENIKARLQPFSEIYLKSGYLYNSADNLFYVIGFAVIAGFILIISCFNFVNLFIATNLKGSTETGIKRVLGANRKTFARHVVLEILIYLTFALIFSILLTHLSLPFLFNIIKKELQFSLLDNLPLSLFLVTLSVAILIICGILPYLQMIYTNTAGAIKGIPAFSSKSVTKTLTQGRIRKVLVITQFTIGIMLILAAIIINKQLNLIKNHDIGYNKDQVLVIDNSIGDSYNRFSRLKEILSENPKVQSLASGNNVPSYGINNWGNTSVAGNKDQSAPFCGFIAVTDDYFETIGSTLLSGRFFDKNKTSDKDKVIINESLMKTLGLKKPLGTILTNIWSFGDKEIIGVVKNIEYHTIHYGGIPALFLYKPDHSFYNYQNIIIKLHADDLAQTVSTIRKEWNSLSPDIPMSSFFLDELFDSTYQTEIQTTVLVNIMTVIAALLCCLGLFGLALFNINARIKEIGVRKINGARSFEIMFDINKEFITWILLSIVIAVPISSWFIMKWLNNFAVKTPFPWWAVLLTGITAMGIGFLTVSWHSWRAATRNPVEALRYE
jgi:putative ABC transport system permease protein